mmetsp:Transcript_13052/g.31148  ORF Transcript_13052/g.31148 Transcript_13052/m.31148 type:complete len:240 (+) Transcript_13052:803-1522(+)
MSKRQRPSFLRPARIWSTRPRPKRVSPPSSRPLKLLLRRQNKSSGQRRTRLRPPRIAQRRPKRHLLRQNRCWPNKEPSRKSWRWACGKTLRMGTRRRLWMQQPSPLRGRCWSWCPSRIPAIPFRRQRLHRQSSRPLTRALLPSRLRPERARSRPAWRLPHLRLRSQQSPLPSRRSLQPLLLLRRTWCRPVRLPARQRRRRTLARSQPKAVPKRREAIAPLAEVGATEAYGPCVFHLQRR